MQLGDVCSGCFIVCSIFKKLDLQSASRRSSRWPCCLIVLREGKHTPSSSSPRLHFNYLAVKNKCVIHSLSCADHTWLVSDLDIVLIGGSARSSRLHMLNKLPGCDEGVNCQPPVLLLYYIIHYILLFLYYVLTLSYIFADQKTSVTSLPLNSAILFFTGSILLSLPSVLQ